ncbi:MAG TPA: hypothetical protein VN706_17655 [Gemmatimonadaceae bacterium]|nr:hypothetical protein [Gemmatimonadaceae bacterium]
MSRDGGSVNAKAVARRLVERGADGEVQAEALGAAMQRAAGQVVDDLRSVVGADGLDALLDRAIARAQHEHPAVASMRRADDSAGIPLNVMPAIEAHGAAAARAGLEAVLAALVDILTALIGADMVRNLLHADDS